MKTKMAIVVEDTEALRLTLRLALEDEGYSVLETTTASEALPLLQQMPEPAVVVLDHFMPEMTGIELLELALEDATLQRHAYALTTVLREKSLPPSFAAIQHTLKVRFVPKPFEIEHFLWSVSALEALVSNSHH
jgi:CheY-like chemotaxis protein